MAAYVHYPTPQEWEVITTLLSTLREGGIIVPPETVEELKERGVTQEQLDGLTYLEDYGFGGEADVLVDVARDNNYAFGELLEALLGESEDAGAQETGAPR